LNSSPTSAAIIGPEARGPTSRSDEMRIRLKDLFTFIDMSIVSKSLNSRMVAYAPQETKRLRVGRLVDKSKGSKTKLLAFHESQLRRRRPVREKPPSLAHDKGLD
jgi:hypothetical protein